MRNDVCWPSDDWTPERTKETRPVNLSTGADDEAWMIRPWQRGYGSDQHVSAAQQRNREELGRAQREADLQVERAWDGHWRKAHPERAQLPVTRFEAAHILAEMQAESEDRADQELARRNYLRTQGW